MSFDVETTKSGWTGEKTAHIRAKMEIISSSEIIEKSQAVMHAA